MSEFDFEALEREMLLAPAFTLAERAAEAWVEEKAEVEMELIEVAMRMVDDVLDVAVIDNPRVSVRDARGGTVSMTLEGLRFKVEVFYRGEKRFRGLFLRDGDGWTLIRSLADLGRLLEG